MNQLLWIRLLGVLAGLLCSATACSGGGQGAVGSSPLPTPVLTPGCSTVIVGVGSLPIVMLVGVFSGAVAALQAILALVRFQQERWVVLVVSQAKELLPHHTCRLPLCSQSITLPQAKQHREALRRFPHLLAQLPGPGIDLPPFRSCIALRSE